MLGLWALCWTVAPQQQATLLSGGCSALDEATPAGYRCRLEDECRKFKSLPDLSLPPLHGNVPPELDACMDTHGRYPWVDETKAQDASNNDLTWTDATSFCALPPRKPSTSSFVGRRDGNGRMNQLTCVAKREEELRGQHAGNASAGLVGTCCATGCCKYTNFDIIQFPRSHVEAVMALQAALQTNTRPRPNDFNFVGGFNSKGTVPYIPLTLRRAWVVPFAQKHFTDASVFANTVRASKT